MCKGSYIVNIDADEIPHKQLMSNIKTIIEIIGSIFLIYFAYKISFSKSTLDLPNS